MSPKSDLEYLLSKEYEPEEQSPHKFLQSYRLLADHRDDLQEQCKAKAKRRAEKKASEGQFMEFNVRIDCHELIVLS